MSPKQKEPASPPVRNPGAALLLGFSGGAQMRDAVAGLLAGDCRYALVETEARLQLIEDDPPGRDGLALLGKTATPAVLVAHRVAAGRVVAALGQGASDYFVLPEERARFREGLATLGRMPQLPAQASAADPPLTNILGGSPAMQRVLKLISKLAQRPAATVLLRGETGTGKGLFARALHHSESAPFIEVNCTAIPEQLLEAELFGHEKGAFTGAQIRRKGLLESAHGGTLFLDEIGHMSLTLQAKILGAIEEKCFRRVGSNETVRVSTRIVAATHANLEQEVAAGRFREDLYYRLSVVPIVLPPLRERGEDVSTLADHFLRKFATDYGVGARQLTASAHARLLQHPWKGNVRELRNTIERAVLLAEHDDIHADEIQFIGEVDPAQAPGAVDREGLSTLEGRAGFRILVGPEGRPLRWLEQRSILGTLALTGGNRSRAARILEISRPRLARVLQREAESDQQRSTGEPSDRGSTP